MLKAQVEKKTPVKSGLNLDYHMPSYDTICKVLLAQVQCTCASTVRYLDIKTPLNNYINGKIKNNEPNVDLAQPETPLDNNIQLSPIDFKMMNVPTQMYIQQRTKSKDQKFDEENNLMQPVKYEKLR